MKFFKRNLKEQKNIVITDEAVEFMNRLITILDEEINNIYEAYNLMSEKYNIYNLPFILNSVLFFKTNIKDIVLATKQMISEKDELQKNLNARTVALHLYDFLDYTKDFLGPNMRKELEVLPDSDFHIQELNKLKKYYQTIKESIFQELRDIRHSVIAHKDKNSIELHKKIKEINPDKINSSCMIVWVLITFILRFQKNIIISIRTNDNKKDELHVLPDASFDIDDNKNKLISIDNTFNEIFMLINDISIRNNNNKKDELQSLPDVSFKIDDNENKLISIDHTVNEIFMLINDISPTEVKFFNELPPVILDKLKELGNANSLSEDINKLSHNELISIYNVIRKYEKIKLNSQK